MKLRLFGLGSRRLAEYARGLVEAAKALQVEPKVTVGERRPRQARCGKYRRFADAGSLRVRLIEIFVRDELRQVFVTGEPILVDLGPPSPMPGAALVGSTEALFR